MIVLAIIIVTALLVFLQRRIYKHKWDNNLTVDLQFSKSEVFEGESCVLSEVIINKKILPLPFLAVKFQVSKSLVFDDEKNSSVTDYYYRHDMFGIMMYQKITRSLPFTCTKRGFYQIRSIDVISNNILSDEKLVKHATCETDLTVYPKMIDIDTIPVLFKSIAGDILTKRYINPDPFLYKGIREYQPFDNFKSIHFKASAKTNELMVSMHDFTVSQEVYIYLNLQPYKAHYGDTLFEAAISMVATLADYYINEGISVGFTSGSDFSHAGQSNDHLFTLLSTLAHINLLDTAIPIADVLPRQASANTFYIIISTYSKMDLYEAFDDLRSNGAEILWVLPCFANSEQDCPDDEYIVRWEVGQSE